MRIQAIPKLPPNLRPRKPEPDEYLTPSLYPVRDADASDYKFSGGSRWGIFYPLRARTFGLPRSPACYCICFGRKLIYIGSSVNLHARAHGHTFKKSRRKDEIKTEWGICNRNDLVIKYKTFRDNGEWLALEYRLIKRLHPPGNKRGVER
jgi:hypothetical protein